jgi:hypothetical protein
VKELFYWPPTPVYHDRAADQYVVTMPRGVVKLSGHVVRRCFAPRDLARALQDLEAELYPDTNEEVFISSVEMYADGEL